VHICEGGLENLWWTGWESNPTLSGDITRNLRFKRSLQYLQIGQAILRARSESLIDLFFGKLERGLRKDTSVMFSKTKRDLEKAFKCAATLLNSKRHDPNDLDSITTDIGVYFFRSKETGKIAYVGRAIGKKGLRQRIKYQHLRSSYTKSVFRKQLAKKHDLNPGQGAVSFIKDNFSLSFIPFEKKDENIVRFVERMLINEYSPPYNRD